MSRIENVVATSSELSITDLRKSIYMFRGQQVMIDSDLATIYEVDTKVLKRAVRRNMQRFPEDFMYELSKEEVENLRCQLGTSSSENMFTLDIRPNLRCQLGTSSFNNYTEEQVNPVSHGGTRYLPFAFTEPGIAMLSSVLQSEHAIQINIGIMRTFILLRQRSNMDHVEMLPKLESIHNELKELRQKFDLANSKPQIQTSTSKPPMLDRVKFIQSLVAGRWGLGIEDLVSATRTKTVTLARHIAIFLIRNYLGLGLHEIGQHFGNRDHTTILHAYNKIRAELEDRISIKKEIESLQNEIKPVFA